jgi:type III pantothenate kinase
VNLLIDIGNSRIKAGRATGDRIFALEPCEWRKVPAFDACSRVFAGITRPERVLVSNVAGNTIATALTQWFDKNWRITPEFVSVRQDFMGLHTHYDRPAQLGIDRWLAALAAFHRARGAACVIDAGTAFTVDVVTSAGAHRGGLIAPGLALMARSLTQGTAQLSLDRVQAVDRFATNTASAISLGCREAMAGILWRVAERWRREIDETPRWFVTGGEAAVVQELSPFEVEVVPDLVLQGLALVGEHRP